MKTTTKHFDYFVKECKKALLDFGITGWDITYEHAPLDRGEAATSFSLPQRAAVIRLNLEWSWAKVTEKELKISAWHEVAHFIIARLDLIGRDRYVSETELTDSNEEAVNTIINFLRKIKHI